MKLIEGWTPSSFFTGRESNCKARSGRSGGGKLESIALEIGQGLGDEEPGMPLLGPYILESRKPRPRKTASLLPCLC